MMETLVVIYAVSWRTFQPQPQNKKITLKKFLKFSENNYDWNLIWPTVATFLSLWSTVATFRSLWKILYTFSKKNPITFKPQTPKHEKSLP